MKPPSAKQVLLAALIALNGVFFVRCAIGAERPLPTDIATGKEN